MAKKKCSKCGETKPIEEFHMNKQRNSPQSYCKSCAKEEGKRYYKYNAIKDWERKLRKKYGITAEEYYKLEETQQYSCKVCGIHKDSLGKRLCVDHCHDTGLIRGLLCDKCNTGIGKLGDSIEGLQRALKYLEGAYADNN
jgi:hypothetical protein